jgi:hypothetical protein
LPRRAPRRWQEPQDPVLDCHIRARRCHVDTIDLELELIADRDDLDRRIAGQDLGEDALVPPARGAGAPRRTSCRRRAASRAPRGLRALRQMLRCRRPGTSVPRELQTPGELWAPRSPRDRAPGCRWRWAASVCLLDVGRMNAANRPVNTRSPDRGVSAIARGSAKF